MTKRTAALTGQRLCCPHCDVGLVGVPISRVTLAGCTKCHGVWVETKSFQNICRDRNYRAGALGLPRVLPMKCAGAARRLKCPVCFEGMEATNFEHCDGVVIDICRRHGTWLDADELQEIASFMHRNEEETLRKFEVKRSGKKAEEVWAKSANSQSESGASWWDGLDVAGGVFEIGCSVFSLFDG